MEKILNLTRLFETQDILDKRIVKEKGLEGQDLLPQKILALQVELGECANEWRGFKFWSERNEPIVKPSNPIEHGNPLLEEYVDCLHFILSIGNEIRAESLDFSVPDVQETDVTHQILSLMREVNSLHHLITHGMAQPLDAYRIIILRFVNLGRMLGFTWEQIEQAYFDKNAVNHVRQDTGY